MQVEAVRVTLAPMEPGHGTPPDACWVVFEVYYNNHWWSEASRNFHLTPGENRQRAYAWIAEGERAMRAQYQISADVVTQYVYSV